VPPHSIVYHKGAAFQIRPRKKKEDSVITASDLRDGADWVI
jgi:hypothetical protein